MAKKKPTAFDRNNREIVVGSRVALLSDEVEWRGLVGTVMQIRNSKRAPTCVRVASEPNVDPPWSTWEEHDKVLAL